MQYINFPGVLRYRCLLPTGTLAAFERLSGQEWHDVAVAGATVLERGRVVRVDAVQIGLHPSVVLRALPVDIAAKLEVFGLAADSLEDRDQPPASYMHQTFVPLPGLNHAVTKQRHKLAVIGRRFSAEAWIRVGVADVVIEDVLVIESESGRALFVAADHGQPGTLILSTDWHEIPAADAEVAYVRPILS